MGGAGYDYTYGAGRLHLGDSPATIDAGVSLQGRPTAPNAAWSVPLRLIVSGDGVDMVVNTDNTGHFIYNPLEPGSKSIWVKHDHSLATITNVNLVAGSQVLALGLLREGDANNNNSITISDFSIVASTFGKASGDAGYDSRADFNGDNVVSISDFSLLASNFNQSGPPEP
jgi:hypothetical protein